MLHVLLRDSYTHVRNKYTTNDRFMLLGYINYVTGSHYYGRCHLHMHTRGRYVGLVMGRVPRAKKPQSI